MSDVTGVRGRVLPFEFQTQATPNWCGPGATRIALTALRAAVPLVEQVADQRELAVRLGAADAHGADLGIGTDEIDLIVAVLNVYLGREHYRAHRVVAPVEPALVDRLRRALVTGIDAGYPLIANVVSGWRPPGYPVDRDVRHYVTAVGYGGGGDSVVIADPAFGLDHDGWRLATPTYEVETGALAVWMASKGYACA
jgi:hypothetical protein